MSAFARAKRSLYGHAVGLASLIGRGGPERAAGANHAAPRVFYGGARSGHRGGPQVKVDLLQNSFPEHVRDPNIVYLLSGSLYLPRWSLTQFQNRGAAVVLNQNGVFYPAWYPKDWERENARMARALEASDHVFYQSQFCKDCADRFLGMRAGSSEILYNGVDTNHFTPAGSRGRTRFRFLVSGNIGPSTYHRLSDALSALVLARRDGLDIEIRFAGIASDDLARRLERDIAAHDMTEYFQVTGPYGRAQAPMIYQSADAYLMTKYNDPCPNAVLEALASGLPVLYSASGGVPELVGDDAGIALPVPASFDENHAPTPRQIVDGMADIIARREVFATAARKRAVERFDLSLWIARHAETFERLVGGRGRA